MSHGPARSIMHASSSRPQRHPQLQSAGWNIRRQVLLSTLACLGSAAAFMGPAPAPPMGLRCAAGSGTCLAQTSMKLPGLDTRPGTMMLREAAANQFLMRYRVSRTGLLATSCAVKTKIPSENEFEREASAVMLKQQLSPPASSTPFISTSAAAQDTAEEDAALKMRMAEAKEVERRGDLKGAAELLDGILDAFPDHGKVWMRRLQVAQRARDFAGAREIIRRALKRVPGNAILWQAWADMEKALGRHSVARRLFKKGLEANPRLPSLYNSWGGMERDLGDVPRARALFREGLMQNPNSARLLLSLGVLEDCAGNSALARSLLGEGLLLEPANAFLHHALAVLEYKQGRLSSARESLRRAIAVDPDHTKAWLAWGQLEEAEGHPDVARDKYRQGCRARRGRGTVQLWQAWARLEEKAGSERAALEVYGQATRLYKRDVRLLLELAKLHEKRGDIDKALSSLDRAVSVDRYNPYVYQVLGQVQLRQLRVGAARAVFAEGVRMAEEGQRAIRGRGVRQLVAARKRREAAAGEAPMALAVVGSRGEGDGEAEVALARTAHGAGTRGGAGPAGAEEGGAAGSGGRIRGKELASLLHVWGAMELGEGQVEAARELLGRAVGADASQGWLWRACAELEAAHGDEWLARHYFARAVNADARDGSTWDAWARLEGERGNHERARFYAKRGMELSSMQTLSRSRVDPARPLSRRWFRD